jgi:hypothetical protein
LKSIILQGEMIMLPVKITQLLIKMRESTESGSLIWNYDDENTKVSVGVPNFNISLEYSFDMTEELGLFRVFYLDKLTNKQHIFHTTQAYQDYEVVRSLYDTAQSSGLDIQF